MSAADWDTSGKQSYAVQRLTAVLVSSLAPMVYNTLPSVLAVLRRDLHLNTFSTTAFVSAETIGIAIGAIACVALMRWLSPRGMLLLALAILLATDIASAFISSVTVLVALRLFGGAASSVVTGAAFHVYGMRDYERNNGLYLVGLSVTSLLAFLSFSFLNPTRSLMFLAFAAVIAPCLILARSFPRTYVARVLDDSSPSGRQQAPDGRAWLIAALGLAAGAASFLSIGVYWVFLSQIAERNGIPARTVALSLSVGTGASLVTGLLVTLVGQRLRRPSLLAAVTLANVLSILATGYGRGIGLFTLAIAGWYLCIPIYAAISLGYQMAHTPFSRYAVLVGSTQTLLLPAAPIVGALLLQIGGLTLVIWSSASLAIVGSIMLWTYVAWSRQLAGTGSIAESCGDPPRPGPEIA